MMTLPLHALADGNYASPEEGHPDQKEIKVTEGVKAFEFKGKKLDLSSVSVILSQFKLFFLLDYKNTSLMILPIIKELGRGYNELM